MTVAELRALLLHCPNTAEVNLVSEGDGDTKDVLYIGVQRDNKYVILGSQIEDSPGEKVIYDERESA